MDAGKLFHTRGPSTAKDRSPNVVLVSGTSSLVVVDDDLKPDRRRWIRRQSSARYRHEHSRWGTCGPKPQAWTKSVAGPVASAVTAELTWCAPYAVYQWSDVLPRSGWTVVASVDCRQFHKSTNCSNLAYSWWRPGQANFACTFKSRVDTWVWLRSRTVL